MIFSPESLNWWMDILYWLPANIIPEFKVFLHIKVSSVHPQKYQPSTTSSETAKNWSTKGCHYCHLPPGDSHPYCGCHESQGAIFFGNVLDRSISLYNEANIRCLVHLEWTFTPNKTNGWIYTQNDMGRLEKRWVGKSTAGLFERWPFLVSKNVEFLGCICGTVASPTWLAARPLSSNTTNPMNFISWRGSKWPNLDSKWRPFSRTLKKGMRIFIIQKRCVW